MSRAPRRIAPLLATLVAVALLIGPAAAPAQAMAPAQASTAASTASEWGSEVHDRFDIPVGRYSIQAPQENFLGVPTNIETRFTVMLADWQLTAAKTCIMATLTLLGYALRFDLADTLLGPVQRVLGVYQDAYVGRLTGGGWGLIPLALMMCVFWFGLAALRGQVGRGVGEIVTSFVLAVLLGALVANPSALLGQEGLYGRVKDVGVEVAVTAVLPPGDGPHCPMRTSLDGTAFADGCWHPDLEPLSPPRQRADPDYLHAVMQAWLVDMYIRQPHQRMAYGQRLDCPLTLAVRQAGDQPGDHPCEAPYEQGGPHPCVDVYNDILRADPDTVEVVDEWRVHLDPRRPVSRTRSNPDNYMYDMMRPGGIDGHGGVAGYAGCPQGEQLASYLSRPHPDRLVVGLTLFFAVVALFLFVLLGVVVPILLGQLLLALLLVALVFLLPVALLGGASRRLLWRWFGLVLASLFMIVVAVLGLSLMLVVTELLLAGQYRYFSFSLLLATVTSLLFLLVQRRLLRGASAGGQAFGAAIGAIRMGRRGPVAAAGPARAGSAGQAWSRAPAAGITAVTAGSRRFAQGAARAAIFAASGGSAAVATQLSAELFARRRHEAAVRRYDRERRVERDWHIRNRADALGDDMRRQEGVVRAQRHWQRIYAQRDNQRGDATTGQ